LRATVGRGDAIFVPRAGAKCPATEMTCWGGQSRGHGFSLEDPLTRLVQDEAPNGRPKRKRIATEAGAAVLLKAAQAAARRNPSTLSTPPNERKTIPVSTGSSVSDEGDKNIRDDEVEVISWPRMCSAKCHGLDSFFTVKGSLRFAHTFDCALLS